MGSIGRLAVAAVLLAAPLLVAAQAFPSKPITLICPWPAGGTTDAHLRKFAEIAQKYLGQPVVVDNKPGGGGMIGPSNMAKLARPDGYTISQLPITAYRLPHQRPVDWDAINDFTYLIGITGYSFGVVVKADSPFKSFGDLLDYAKANPGKLSYGTPGTGTSPHLLMEEVAMKSGVQFLHVPFKGNADSMQPLLGGRDGVHDVLPDPAGDQRLSLGHARASRVRRSGRFPQRGDPAARGGQHAPEPVSDRGLRVRGAAVRGGEAHADGARRRQPHGARP